MPAQLRPSLLTVALVLACGCPRNSQAPSTTHRPGAGAHVAVDDAVAVATRLTVARAEARRTDGLATLVELAQRGKRGERVLALRGLGRTGGPRALAELQVALRDPDPVVVAAAATAIGVATSLDEVDAGNPQITDALIAAMPRAQDHEADVIEAIGRAAAPSAQAALIARASEPKLAAAIATAFGRYGRRKLELSTEARRAIVALAIGPLDPDARFAVAWALAREQLPKPGAEPDPVLDEAGAALVRLLGDPVAEVRAQAASAIGKRRWAAGRGALVAALADDDWRVAVEAARALAADLGIAGMPPDTAASLIAALDDALVRWQDRVEQGDDVFAQPMLEALRGLAKAAPVLAKSSARGTRSIGRPLVRAWVECLHAAIRVRRAPSTYAPLDAASCELPDHLRLPLIAELVTDKVGSVAVRRAAVRHLLTHADARVRAAGMAALAAMWPEGAANDRRAAIATVVGGLAATDAMVAGSAVEAASALYAHVAPSVEGRAELDAAIVARAAIEKDPELAAGLFDVIAKQKLASGGAACRAGLARNVVAARAAAACLEALSLPVPPVVVAPTEPRDLDVAQVIGKRISWQVETTRGPITIALEPDAAPWAVATIVALAQKGFYDDLEFHRVVGAFVVQGGDPTESGWGGPGFSIPAEPSSGRGFSTHGVGMADSGRDSAGSQWFVMHAPAPHLDGRYTWVGRVVSGGKSADGLLIGDKIVRSTVTIASPGSTGTKAASIEN